MDLSQECPRNEAWEALQNSTVAAFGITLQGASHKRSTPPAPCQDYHAMHWMEDEGIFLAAIADGVGSCKLSHWGAYTAVNAALESTREALSQLSGGKILPLDAKNVDFRKQIKEVMVSAFRAAQEAVERLADEAEPPQMVFSMQQCVNRGSVTGNGRAGGIAGSANTAKGASVIEGCENQGNVSSDSCAGGILGWGVDPNLAWKDGDAGSLTIAKCRNSGNVSVASGTAGGILSRLMNGGYDYIIEITQCENTGAIHSDGIGRLGGVLGGCTAGYVFGLEEKAACYIRSCVNSGVLSYGDATVNVADYTAGETDDGRALNATEKAVIAMGGSAVGGMVGASFGTVVESCLNRGLVMLPAGTVPISDIEANVRLTDEDSVAFVGGIYGLSLCGSSDASKNERVTDCAYTDSFTAAVYAPFLPADSEAVAGNRQVTAEEADALAAELLH